mgnify:CR=1 FL=1
MTPEASEHESHAAQMRQLSGTDEMPDTCENRAISEQTTNSVVLEPRSTSGACANLHAMSI